MPTDEVFEKLPKGTVEDLLKPENKKKLVSILTLPRGGWTGDGCGRRETQGSQDRGKDESKEDEVNDANVVKTDIICKNGVIHIIDAVILPK